MSLKGRFVLYLALAHLPFALLAVYALAGRRTMLVAVEALFVLSFVVGLRLVRSLFGTLDLVRSGAQFIQERDFATRFREVGQPETDQLVRVYNRMVDHLREERLRLQEQHFFLEKILRASPSGILTLDLEDRIATVNPAAERFLRSGAGEIEGRRLGEIDGAFARELAELAPGESKVIPLTGRRRLKCHRSEFLDRGFARAFYVMEELTEELHRSEKAAYEKLIRMMSHEVNNSVGAATSLLESCLNYGVQLRPEDRDDFVTALRIVIARSGQLDEFMRAFSEVVRIPPPRRRPVDLGAALDAVAVLFRAEVERRRIRFVREGVAADPGPVAADPGQLEQVLVNVVKNAIEAIGEDGTITLRLGRRAERPFVEIEDTGPGLTPEVRENLFTPFFSTKANGQGLGLTTVQEILTRHDLDFSLEGGPGQPTRFTIVF